MDKNIREGFFKFAKEEKQLDPFDIGLGVGATTAAGATAVESAKNYVIDRAEDKSRDMVGTYQKFKAKLKPGDIIYSGYNPKDSFDVMLGKNLKFPLKVSQMVQIATGNKNYHGMIYLGNGLIAQAEGDGMPLAIRKLKDQMKGQRVKAYRPTAATQKEVQSAINYAKKVKGTRYKNPMETFRQGLNMVFNPTMGPKTCRKTKNGIVCNTLVTKAYPKQFPRENMSINQVRGKKGVEFVAGMDRIKKSPVSDKVINRLVNPALKSLKWAIPAAAVAGFAAKHLSDKDKSKIKNIAAAKEIKEKKIKGIKQ